MNFALLYPAALAALATLAIPLLLHVIRRAENVTTPFAAMRWIAAQLRQQRRLRFRDLPLLLLRLLLLALLVLLLAQPVLRGDVTAASHWVLVAPGANVDTARQRLGAVGADWRWLAPGFPALATQAAPAAAMTASLLREIDAELPATSRISVVVPAIVDGLDGERPTLSRDVEWIVVDGTMPPRQAVPQVTPGKLVVRSVDAMTRPVVDALATAWKQSGWAEMVIDDSDPESAIDADVEWLLWLAPQRPAALLAWVEAGGTAVAIPAAQENRESPGIALWRDADQEVVATLRQRGRGRLIELRGNLLPAQLPALLDGDFPQRLHALFAGEPPAPTRASADALKPTRHDALGSGNRATQATRTPLDPWLILLVAIVFAIERLLASTRRRVAP